MKRTVNFNDFSDAFKAMRPDNFSYDGLKALFENIEELEDSTGSEFELDVIAICCDFTEYEDIEEFNNNYDTEYESYDDITEMAVIPVDDERFIIDVFRKE